jgi:hypothetical protein
VEPDIGAAGTMQLKYKFYDYALDVSIENCTELAEKTVVTIVLIVP